MDFVEKVDSSKIMGEIKGLEQHTKWWQKMMNTSETWSHK
jgi:hypothetical protein